MAQFELDGKRANTPANGRFWIADNAVVIGDVTLEEDASVWFGCTLRGDAEPIVIGRGSNIQDGCVVHTDPGFPVHVGADCTIGHMVMLHGCTIGAGSLIGIGAIVLNGASIGAGSLVGAGTLIPEGKSYPPNSMILGTPGKVIRQLTPADADRLKRGATHYVANWQRFSKGLKRLDG
jgi:carbonic anhydrase/acetyltransferase-like protein (isoleucine patch superfamily)